MSNILEQFKTGQYFLYITNRYGPILLKWHRNSAREEIVFRVVAGKLKDYSRFMNKSITSVENMIKKGKLIPIKDPSMAIVLYGEPE